ncbi:MAG: hypothetical protein ACT4N2_13195 [Hyphomicrobium sp.]
MTTTGVTASGQVFDGILHTQRWTSSTLTYSFPTSASFYAATYSANEEPDVGFEALNALQQAAVLQL